MFYIHGDCCSENYCVLSKSKWVKRQNRNNISGYHCSTNVKVCYLLNIHEIVFCILCGILSCTFMYFLLCVFIKIEKMIEVILTAFHQVLTHACNVMFVHVFCLPCNLYLVLNAVPWTRDDLFILPTICFSLFFQYTRGKYQAVAFLVLMR